MSIGVWQIVLILVLVLVIFGAGKLPQVMGDVALGLKSFRRGLREEDEVMPSATESLAETQDDSARG